MNPKYKTIDKHYTIGYAASERKTLPRQGVDNEMVMENRTLGWN
jgi:hypothetical protein